MDTILKFVSRALLLMTTSAVLCTMTAHYAHELRCGSGAEFWDDFVSIPLGAAWGVVLTLATWRPIASLKERPDEDAYSPSLRRRRWRVGAALAAAFVASPVVLWGIALALRALEMPRRW